MVSASAAALLLIVWSYPQFKKYYLQAPVEMLIGIALAALLYSPTLVFLAFMMRRKRVPGLFFWGVPLSVILFFGPVTSHLNHALSGLGIPDFLYVGFSEETLKITPLLLILLFARPAVTGVRDGILYGALGGFGFACLEMAAYFALVEYPETGWSDFFVNSLSRATYLGTDLHIVFSAFLGGCIAWGWTRASGWKKVGIPLAGYLVAVVTHGFQDSFGKLLAVIPTVAAAKIMMYMGISRESLESYTAVLTVFGATANLLLVNVINLSVLVWMLLNSGDRERRIIRGQLQDEQPPVIEAVERKSLDDQRRYHRRKLGSDDRRNRRIVHAQNELAFRRCQPWRAKRRLVDPSSREAALLTRRAHSARGEAK